MLAINDFIILLIFFIFGVASGALIRLWYYRHSGLTWKDILVSGIKGTPIGDRRKANV
ncbi:hypothetical protein HUN88_06455 [Bacillus amyloliquefaciens]|uniref:hypothetical protein n=1 Tax=Bacillus amyloliquefaciens TaxID=1390 RepID=UPI0015811ECB|nr:hypothetical protein [Bacillus amyloliquefaciens]NUI59397.1 hypothetical protein [Bacillus amyloliquefaciens]